MDTQFWIVRCGAKTKNIRVKVGGSKLPLGKEPFNELKVTKNGCIGINGDKTPDPNCIVDYNHYRSINKSLKGTEDRAVSIVTRDIYNKLNEILRITEEHSIKVEIGDLGENITLENIEYYDFEVGTIIKLNNVVLEITEPCIACFRLGTVTWADIAGGTNWWRKKNNTSISNFINIPGARGWYAKVLTEGNVFITK